MIDDQLTIYPGDLVIKTSTGYFQFIVSVIKPSNNDTDLISAWIIDEVSLYHLKNVHYRSGYSWVKYE